MCFILAELEHVAMPLAHKALSAHEHSCNTSRFLARHSETGHTMLQHAIKQHCYKRHHKLTLATPSTHMMLSANKDSCKHFRLPADQSPGTHAS